MYWLLNYLSIYRASDISQKKKVNFCGIFRGKFAEKLANFAGKKSKFAENRPISRDFNGKKSNFEGFSAGNFAKKQSVKNSRFRWIFLANFAKIDQFCVDMTSVV